MRRNTGSDLIADLEKRNSKGRLYNTIRAAKDGYFHSWKSPVIPDVRSELLRQLSIYPETYDLYEAAMMGEYYDEPDRSDCITMRNNLLKDYPIGHSIYQQLGLTDEILEKRFGSSET